MAFLSVFEHFLSQKGKKRILHIHANNKKSSCSRVLLGYLEAFKGYDFLQICAGLLIVEMLT